jgi:multimeric flavodoxin WrbA
MGTPTYYGNVSSQLKAFIDRTYSWLKSDYLFNPALSRGSLKKVDTKEEENNETTRDQKHCKKDEH